MQHKDKDFESMLDKLSQMSKGVKAKFMKALTGFTKKSITDGGSQGVLTPSIVEAPIKTVVHTRCISCNNKTTRVTTVKYKAQGVPLPGNPSVKDERLWCPECQERLIGVSHKELVKQYVALCQSIQRQPINRDSVYASLPGMQVD